MKTDIFITLTIQEVIDKIDDLAWNYPITINGEVKVTRDILNHIINSVEENKPIQGYEFFSVTGVHPIFFNIQKIRKRTKHINYDKSNNLHFRR